MAKVTGVGGVFIKADDPAELAAWYARHLGIPVSGARAAGFEWREKDRPARIGQTLFAIFPETTRYFEPSAARHMLNFRVDDLDGLLEGLRAAGAEVDGDVVEEAAGRFAWIMDPEGNRIELWQPAEPVTQPG